MYNIISRGRSHLFPLAVDLHRKGQLKYLLTNWPAFKVKSIPNEHLISEPLWFLPYFFYIKKFGFSEALFDLSIQKPFRSRRVQNILEDATNIVDVNIASEFPDCSSVIDMPSNHPDSQIECWKYEQKLTGCRIPRLDFALKLSKNLARSDVLEKCQRIVIPSEGAAGQLPEHLREKAIVNRFNYEIPSVSDTNLSKRIFDGKVRICCVGIVCPSKGIHYLILALKSLMAHKTCEVTLVGQSTNKKYNLYLMSIYPELQIKFTGFLSGETYWKRLKSADLFVMPSVSEGLPLSALEAISLGSRLVYSDKSNLQEVLGISRCYKYDDTASLAGLVQNEIDDITHGKYNEADISCGSRGTEYFSIWSAILGNIQ